MPVFRRLIVASAVVLLSVLGFSAPARAQASLLNGFGGVVDYGTECLSPNDDGSSAVVDLTPAFPQGLHFFTGTHTTAYVNTNGNITFSGPVSTYTPWAFPVAAQPMIAPYWGDVDIRYTGGYCQGSAGLTCVVCAPCHHPSENGVWWFLEPGRMVVTWDRVGYYSCNMNWRMSFQLVITEAGCAGAGDFDVEFRYNQCEWETGDASGGDNGFGGTEAQAGFDAGNQTDYVAIPGSMAPGIANTLCTTSNVNQTGIWQFQIRSGAILCPDAGSPCDTELLGVCAEGRTNCVGSGTECVQDILPTAEECDILDNDCDGQIDEDDDGPLCPDGESCLEGKCVEPCTEFGCDEGEICGASGLCIDELCIGVECDPGLICREGVCVGPCDGVVCPFGLDCRAGSCIDLCENFDCDICTVCEDGLCVPKCEDAPCESDETCQPDGHCIETPCAGVTCNAGHHCDNGNCVDSCIGAVCPEGEICAEGACIDAPSEQPDGGTDFADGSFEDAAPPSDPDGGGAGGGGDLPPLEGGGAGDGPGCGCYVVGLAPSLTGAFAGLVFLVVVTARRRRRTAR